MGNFPRYIPEVLLVEVTTRTMQGRLLLVPFPDLNDIVCGVLARVLSRCRVEIVDFKVKSNRVHLLPVPENAKALADRAIVVKVVYERGQASLAAASQEAPVPSAAISRVKVTKAAATGEMRSGR